MYVLKFIRVNYRVGDGEVVHCFLDQVMRPPRGGFYVGMAGLVLKQWGFLNDLKISIQRGELESMTSLLGKSDRTSMEPSWFGFPALQVMQLFWQ